MIKHTFFRFILVGLVACTGCADKIPTPETDQIVGMASPVQLGVDETEILFADFFKNPEKVGETVPPIGVKVKERTDNGIVLVGSLSAPIDVLTVEVDGVTYSLLLKKSSIQKVTLTLSAEGKEYQTVQVKGDMNAWNPNSTTLQKEGDVWSTTIEVEEGIYQYLFMVDGQELVDPGNPNKVSNGMGGFNSLLTVGNPGAVGPLLQTTSTDGNTVNLSLDGGNEVIAFWQNQRIETVQNGDEISLNIPEAAQAYDRSFVRVWAHDGERVSQEMLVPIDQGIVVTEAQELTRHDFQAWNMYFVLIDRFKDGNPSNTRKVDDPDIDPKVNFWGGDFAGITQKIQDGYFDQIGVNTLWLSPITQNPEGAYGYWDQGGPETKFSGYHGYWPISSSKTDDRFGTADEFQELLDEAHANGMNVILDYVANHVHEEHPVYQTHPEWATDLYLPDGTMNTQLWDEQRLTTWFDTFMPSLDYSNPEVIDAMTDSALFWVTNFDLDGIRHDATKHIQLEFWRTLTRKIKENVTYKNGRQLYQVGETYGSRPLIASYINSGMLDSQFDFGMFDAAQNAFGQNTSFTGLRDQMLESFRYYGNHNLMGYISGNHDKPRFISLTSGDVRWNEDAKIAGWTREIGYPNEYAYKRLQMLHAWNMTIPGIPVTYQGDEFGQPGANDPDNRRWMQFNDSELRQEELANRQVFSKLTNLREKNLALTYGDFVFHQTEENTLVYSRRYFEDQAVVIFNKSDKEQTITVDLRDGADYANLEPEFGHNFSMGGSTLTITLPAKSFEILTQ